MAVNLISSMLDTSTMDTNMTITLSFVISFIYYLWLCRGRMPSDVPADPEAKLWVGSMLHISKNQLNYYDEFLKIKRSHGEAKCVGFCYPRFNLLAPVQSWIMLGVNPKLTEHILKTNFDNYIKGSLFEHRMGEIFGRGLFNVDGVEWKKQRKLASHIFTSRNLKDNMSLVFHENTKTVMSTLSEYAQSGQQFDIQQLFFTYTLDSFAEIAFGSPLGCMTGDASAIKFGRDYDRLQICIMKRFPSATWELERMLGTRNEGEIAKLVASLDKYLTSMVANCRAIAKRPGSKGLMTAFIKLAEQGNEELTDVELKDFVMNWLAAGRDTTATLLAWTTWELTQSPEWEQRLVTLIKATPQDTEAFSELSSSPKVLAFLHEVLRLHPSVPNDSKMTVNDDVFPDGTKVRAGTLIQYSPYIFGRSHTLWGPDPEVFRPDRWLRDDGSFNDVSPYVFPVFNGGFRNCLGKAVALREAGLLLVEMLSKFSFTVDSGFKAHYAVALVASITGGLPVRVHARR